MGTQRQPYVWYAHTVYQYDRLGQLVGVTDDAGNQTTIAYDMAGRKTSMSDPDMGNWTYQYDAAGNLTSQTDARGVTTTITYDALNRVTYKSYSDSTPGLMFHYDDYSWIFTGGLCTGIADATKIGHLTVTAVGSVISHQDCYDARGHQVRDRTTVDSVGYETDTSYAQSGAVHTLSYPDGEMVTYGYDSAGDPTNLTSNLGTQYVTNTELRPWGAIDTMTRGTTPTPTTTSYGYDFRDRLTSIVTGTAQNLTLTYDAASNVKTVTDNTSTESAAYTYDVLNRLTLMTINGTTAATYGYNTIGNMTAKVESYTGMLNPTSLTLTYPNAGQPRPHAVTSTSGSASLALVYDANGDLATQGSAVYTYDAENRLKTRTATTGAQSYAYDAGGTLIKRYNAADGSWTAYVGGLYEKNSDGSTVKYYRAAGRTVAVRKSGVVSYLLADHLGSTVGVLDASGALIATQSYWPYGATRATTGVLATDKQYTRQQQESGDAALGLYNYKARFYSTVLGRFVSADTVADGLNRYEYVHDNPLRFVDPSGRCFTFPGQAKFDCSSQDAENWLNWAMTRQDWVGDVARWGLGGEEYWSSVLKLVPFDGKLPGHLFADFAEGVQHDTSSFHNFGTVAWAAFGGLWHINPRYLEASAYDLFFGTSAISLVLANDPRDIIGAYNWAASLPNWGGDQDSWNRLKAAAYCLCTRASQATLESVTLAAAAALNVNHASLAWSDIQMDYLVPRYSPHQKFDPLQLQERVMEFAPDFFGLFNVAWNLSDYL